LVVTKHPWDDKICNPARVGGIEPGINPPAGQNTAETERTLARTRPGQSRVNDVKLSVVTDRDEINKFRKTAGE